jgi:hypothetical protein
LCHAAIALAPAPPAWASAAAAPDPVPALAGQQAPGTPAGALFKSFGAAQYSAPVVNDAGDAAFFARLRQGAGGVDAQNDGGVWSSGGGGALELVARRGLQAPGAPSGAVFDWLDDPRLNVAGDEAAFRAYLRRGVGGVDGLNDSGIWIERGGQLGLLARSGDVAPDTLGAVFYGVSEPAMNRAGEVAFQAGLLPGVGDAATANSGGVWAERGGALRLVARSGDPAPGTPAGVTFGAINAPLLNSAGQIALFADLKGVQTFPLTLDVGVWAERNNALELVARTGMQAPGAPAGTRFVGFYAMPAMNAAGHLALPMYLALGGGGVNSDNASGVWSDRTGSLELVVRGGAQAPDAPAGARFTHFPYVKMNNAGDIAMIAGLRAFGGGGVDEENDSGVWVERGGALRLAVREGDQAPGAPPGAVFGHFGTGLNTPALNSQGRLAFMNTLKSGGGGVTIDNYVGIWAEDIDGVLRLIARTGDVVDVDDGPLADLRTISELSFIAAGNEDDGWPTGFNARGDVAYFAAFTDGSAGVFVSSLAAVPEAASWRLALVGTIGLAWHSWGARRSARRRD